MLPCIDIPISNHTRSNLKMHFTQVFTALTLAGSAVAAPPPKYGGPAPPKAQGLATAMQARGREFIGTALTLRGNATEEAIARNNADFNSLVASLPINNGYSRYLLPFQFHPRECHEGMKTCCSRS